MNKAWMGLGSLVVVTVSCGGGGEGTGTVTSSAEASSGSGVLCTPGQQIACACPGGAMGAQTCRENGSGFEPCLGCDSPSTSASTTSSGATSSSGAGGASSSSAGVGGHGGSASNTTSSGNTSTSTSSASSGGGCVTGPNLDVDQDGWTLLQGDCDDCNSLVNPGAIDLAGNQIDDDCSGMVDDTAPDCDQGLALADADPLNAVKAVDLCKLSTGPKDWGVVSAKWVVADGSGAPANPNFHLGHGVLPAFGFNVHVQTGAHMLGLSSGTARQPTDPGYSPVGGFDKGYSSSQAFGFPKETPACPGTATGTVHDATGLEVVVRAPSNAMGFSYDFNFFTYDWPGFLCSAYNDFFLAILSPIPMGQSDGNIAFDMQGNLVSVNNSFIDVCGCANQGGPPCKAGGKMFACSLGNQGLLGTGYQDQFTDHGSTGWLITTAPLTPGQQITLRWVDYDSGDGVLDSTTLVDGWQWILTPGVTVGTTRILAPK